MLNNIYQSLDPVAFSLGPLCVRWYGIAYVLGFICAALIIWRTGKRWKIRISEDALMTVMLCAIVGIILGARLGYVLFYGSGYYLQNPGEILAFSNGGMSFHGGLIGALLGGILAAKITRIPYLTLADIAVIGAPLGLFFGRCANFINGELWGAPTDAPWGVVFANAGGVARHPSQLYEAVLEGLVIFIVLFALSRKQPPRSRGTFLGAFLVMYSTFRFCVEFVRLPDSQLGYLFGTGWLTMGQLLSVPLFVAGVCLIAFARVKKLPQQGQPEDAQCADGEFGADAKGDVGDAGAEESVDSGGTSAKSAAHAPEQMDIYDINQKPLGYTKPRGEFLKEHEYVLYSLVILQNAEGKFLITRRTSTKGWAPGSWEVQGGGVRAGESCAAGAVREVREEVGLDVSDALGKPIYKYENTDAPRGDNYIVNIYHAHLNFSESEVKICEREATEFKLAEWEDVCEIDKQGKFLHYKRICEALRAEGVLSAEGVLTCDSKQTPCVKK